MAQYVTYNGVAPATAALAKVTTGTAIKTLLQLAPPSTRSITVVEWGISFDGSAAATPIVAELVQTAVAATVTAHIAAGVMPYDTNDTVVSQLTLGTAGTGYTASAEGTPGVSRLFDCQLIAPSSGYVKQFPLGERPRVLAGTFLRVRVTAAAAVNAICYVVFNEG
jgi:hypothetical protein